MRLKYHFRESSYIDDSIVKLPSTYTPPPYENTELEFLINKIEHLPVGVKKANSNIEKHKDVIKRLERKVQEQSIVIKPADKGSITVIMNPEYYYKMCMLELSKEDCYACIGQDDPTSNIFDVIKLFALSYQAILTTKEFISCDKQLYKSYFL